MDLPPLNIAEREVAAPDARPLEPADEAELYLKWYKRFYMFAANCRTYAEWYVLNDAFSQYEAKRIQNIKRHALRDGIAAGSEARRRRGRR